MISQSMGVRSLSVHLFSVQSLGDCGLHSVHLHMERAKPTVIKCSGDNFKMPILGYLHVRQMQSLYQIILIDGQNRQSPIASVQRMRSTLAGHSAVPSGTNTTPMNANHVIRIAATKAGPVRTKSCVFWGGDMSSNERLRFESRR